MNIVTLLLPLIINYTVNGCAVNDLFNVNKFVWCFAQLAMYFTVNELFSELSAVKDFIKVYIVKDR